MLEEGLFVTLNSDDPPMFDTTLTGEYRVAAEVFGLGPADLAALARNAVVASSIDEEGRKAIIADIDALS
jgi:aminodeoxyfutalosine deaminase